MSTEAVSTPITSTVFDTVLDIPHKPGYPVKNNDHVPQKQTKKNIEYSPALPL